MLMHDGLYPRANCSNHSGARMTVATDNAVSKLQCATVGKLERASHPRTAN